MWKSKAYPGDNKKRRSFLPAPKKSPTSSLPPQQQFPVVGATASSSYTVLQRTYQKGPVTQSSSSSVSPSSSLSSISLPSSSVSSTSLPGSAATSGEGHVRPRLQQVPSYQDESRCGVGLRVGARVKISGIKPGILRYLGTTHLAPGIFCGIELLEADGNHDGEVDGHRYFYCPPNCGIFAPKEKVCIDTSVSGRLSSESDGNLYSSNESLTERTYKAFRSFEEGELEAVDCSVLSPESPRGEPGKRKRNEAEAPPDWGSRSTDSIDSQDLSYFKPKSRLPRSGRGSNIPSPQGPSLKSPGSGGSSYSFGFHKPREDIRGRDCQYQERGKGATRTSDIGEDAEDEDNEDPKYFTRSEAKRQAALSKDKSSHHNRKVQSRDFNVKREPRLDSTFEIIKSPLPSSHLANTTFEIAQASPSIASIRDGRDDVPLTSTPEPGHYAPRFKGDSALPLDRLERHSAGLSSSFSGSETDTDEPDRRLSVTYSLSDSQVQANKTLLYEDDVHGASATSQRVNVPASDDATNHGSHTGPAQLSAYQKGYAPDTDSEIGTLTFNSPNSDWLDRCGVAHPTTFAPPEELGLIDGSQDREKFCQRTSPLVSVTQARTSHSNSAEDANDVTSTTEEDDRIEADQLYGRPVKNGLGGPNSRQGRVPPTSEAAPCSGTSTGDAASTVSSGAPSTDAPSSSQATDEEEEEDEEEENLDDFVSCQDIEFSFKVNAPIDFVAGNSSVLSEEEEEGEAVRRNPKRKAMTLTRKRSENVSHKMPNTSKVTSRLADYIKTPPVPARPREDRDNQGSRLTKNNAKNRDANSPRKRLSAADIGNRNGTPDSRRGSSVEAGGAGDGDTIGGKEGDSSKRHQVTPQPPKPLIKRAPPKSKWGDIMTQIESSKVVTKPKPKSEIKSSLAAYLSTPPPSHADKGGQQDGDDLSLHSSASTNNHTPPRKKFESRIKPLPPPPPKIDLSKVKSKLGVPTAASATKAQPKRDPPTSNRRNISREGSPANPAHKAASSGKRLSEPHILQGKQQKLLSAANTRTNSLADSSILSSARSSITDLSNAAEHLDADGAPSKRGSIDVSRKLSTNSVKSEVSEKPQTKNSHSRSNRRTIEIKSNALPNNISKKPRANGSINKSLSGTPGRGGTPSAAPTIGSMAAQRAEIVRLESLCESRTKELTLAKIQYKDTTRAFDAMAVLLNYCSAELEAFKVQLADCMAQIGELNQDKCGLDSRLQQACVERDQQADRARQAEALTEQGAQEHARLTREMEATHDAALTAQRDELTKQHQEAAAALQEQHSKQFERLKQYHNRQMNDARNECKMEISSLRISHLEEIQELRNKHDAQMEELHKQHRNKLEDITHRFETIKLTLSEKVESLRGECEDLTKRAKNSEEALQRDADVKVQMAIAPFLNLPKEVESLKTVVEMRNDEIQRLRTKNMDLEKQLEEIPIGREKIISLQQKVENLEAIINIKTDHEKQLHEKCQVLMRKYDRESRANKTLSMENEQILWRMSQSAEFGSSDSLASLTTSMTSLPGSVGGSGGCGASSRRHASRTAGGGADRLRQPRAGSSETGSAMSKSFHAGEEVQMRVKHNRASSGSGHRQSTGGGGRRAADWDSERKLRSRSATFVVEKGDGTDGADGESSSGSGGSHSLSSSPQTKPGSRRRGRQLSQGNSEWLNGDDVTISSNLSQSAGAVIHYELPSQASPRRGNSHTSHAPVILSAACTSTPRLDETFEDSSTATVVNNTGEEIVLQGEDSTTNAMMMTSMGSSCTRSISSGVSDSGVYDSMTRSELLNSSMVSTDSEWGTSSNCYSNNTSMTLDATLDLDDHEGRSGPRTRDFSSLNDTTLVNACSTSSEPGSSKNYTATNFTIALDDSPSMSAPPTASAKARPPPYSQQVSVPDDVFDEDMSMESCSFAAGDDVQGLHGLNSLTSSTLSVEEVEEDEEEDGEEDEEEDGGFSVTYSDTVTDLAGVCSKKSPQ
ncbi:hypothetical protein EGW08_014630 [Elysia chlorotica]|uniref:CAP-Gly domain-containing protein n=1 Tax=Elysia chlorotica TaxID=188477 RepID=A0A3S0ZXF6_ELYCH|nr:hypothetical protein EGW08_014630 [Elysia chlorotica]